ncbi:hypothetical protein [Rhodococcus sp. 077-4]|uniref:hypothetical protein n=1 Tax=Rhodococcus sp. 077-4 TaxID=2789271 RepID=UPI0039F52D24
MLDERRKQRENRLKCCGGGKRARVADDVEFAVSVDSRDPLVEDTDQQGVLIADRHDGAHANSGGSRDTPDRCVADAVADTW